MIDVRWTTKKRKFWENERSGGTLEEQTRLMRGVCGKVSKNNTTLFTLAGWHMPYFYESWIMPLDREACQNDTLDWSFMRWTTLGGLSISGWPRTFPDAFRYLWPVKNGISQRVLGTPWQVHRAPLRGMYNCRAGNWGTFRHWHDCLTLELLVGVPSFEFAKNLHSDYEQWKLEGFKGKASGKVRRQHQNWCWRKSWADTSHYRERSRNAILRTDFVSQIWVLIPDRW